MKDEREKERRKGERERGRQRERERESNSSDAYILKETHLSTYTTDTKREIEIEGERGRQRKIERARETDSRCVAAVMHIYFKRHIYQHTPRRERERREREGVKESSCYYCLKIEYTENTKIDIL